MEIIRGLENITHSFQRPVLTLGNFDGVHIGHQTILEEVGRRARAIEGQSIVLTFVPHPLKVLKPEICPPIITFIEQKAEMISRYNIDVLIAANFSKEFAKQTPREFIENILQKQIGAREVIVGYDYGFGRGREGTIDFLKQMGRELNIMVDIVDPVKLDGRIVSSTSLRQTVMSGDVEAAGRLMGRPYQIVGEIVTGHRRGRTIGFPTANIDSKNELFPKRGVYIVYAAVKGHTYQGVANVGFNPTFGDEKISVETHILDFDEDIYGEELVVAFMSRLRSEVKFDGVDSLVEQINKDVVRARKYFSANSNGIDENGLAGA